MKKDMLICEYEAKLGPNGGGCSIQIEFGAFQIYIYDDPLSIINNRNVGGRLASGAFEAGSKVWH